MVEVGGGTDFCDFWGGGDSNGDGVSSGLGMKRWQRKRTKCKTIAARTERLPPTEVVTALLLLLQGRHCLPSKSVTVLFWLGQKSGRLGFLVKV